MDLGYPNQIPYLPQHLFIGPLLWHPHLSLQIRPLGWPCHHHLSLERWTAEHLLDLEEYPGLEHKMEMRQTLTDRFLY